MMCDQIYKFGHYAWAVVQQTHWWDYQKILDQVEKLAMDEQSSLFCFSVHDDEIVVSSIFILSYWKL